MHTASKIQALKNDWDTLPDLRKSMDEALTLNRRLWTILMTGVTEEGNPLPDEIKSNIVNLANFIFRHTIALTWEPRREGLDVLININCNIAAGLRTPVASAAIVEAQPSAEGRAA